MRFGWKLVWQFTFDAKQVRFSWLASWVNCGSVDSCHMTVVVSGVDQSMRQVKVGGFGVVTVLTIVEPFGGVSSVMVGAAALPVAGKANARATTEAAMTAARGIERLIGRPSRTGHASFEP